MGIPINDPAYVFGDNKSVLVNSSKPDSVLKKKNNSIAYHHVRCYFILNILYDDGILFYDDGIFTEVEILQD